MRKTFTPKHKEIPILEDYSVVPPKLFWEKFPSLSWEVGRNIKSQIKPQALFIHANRINYPDMASVMEIVNDIKIGCDVGCRGVNLCPSTSTNAPSAYEHGPKVTDSIADGIKKGIMIGPMEEHQIPFDSVKVNGIMVKLKPDSSARIILNLSQGFPFSVNDEVDNNQFEVYMSSTVRWLRSLHMAGRGCFMAKLN